jgi:hypothetical protein
LNSFEHINEFAAHHEFERRMTIRNILFHLGFKRHKEYEVFILWIKFVTNSYSIGQTPMSILSKTTKGYDKLTTFSRYPIFFFNVR